MRSLHIILKPVLGGLLAIVLVVAPVAAPFGPAPLAAAADASLTIAALHVLQQQYAEPVHPVPLLNAAIATLRKASNLGPGVLPDIHAGVAEDEAAIMFATEFQRAARAGTLPETPLAYATTAGMLASLHDSHTYFLDPAALREARRELSGNPSFTGIGVTITGRKDASGAGWIFIEDVIPGSPAEASGLKRFDKILQVNGRSMMNVDVGDASQLIRGPAGSTVMLVVQRSGQSVPVSVTRTPIRVPAVEASFVRPGVAYVKIFEFSKGTGRQLRGALERLNGKEPIRAAILDLRGNPGGFIDEAARVGDNFLPPRTILAVMKDRGSEPSYLRTAGSAPFLRTPLVALVDGGSASASEILAGAFKDYHRAIIIGERTAGALGGSVVVALPEGGMSITVERIYPPRGEQVEGAGIAPNADVKLTAADMERGDDTQLDAALRALQSSYVVTPQSATSTQLTAPRHFTFPQEWRATTLEIGPASPGPLHLTGARDGQVPVLEWNF